MTKIGIPGSLFYYVYYPKWKKFFHSLGFEVITSGQTTKKILDDGVREALNEACAPVKVFFGHSIALKDKVDYLFIPRIVSIDKKTVFCPKFLGMPDMIRHGIENMPTIIDTRIDTREEKFAVWKAYKQIGELLGVETTKIFFAYRQALKEEKRFHNLLTTGYHPTEAISLLNGHTYPQKPTYEFNFVLLGYPYILYDPYISVQIIDKLQNMGVNVFTPENIPEKFLKRQKLSIKKDIFWKFSDNILRAIRYYLNTGKIDGIIHLTAFGCGPDSLVNSYIYRELKNYPGIPFTTLTIDEHSGEAGITTRLEAFIDMVKRKKKGDSRCPIKLLSLIWLNLTERLKCYLKISEMKSFCLPDRVREP